MYDVETGNMVEIPPKMATELTNKTGYCILTIGEIINIKTGKYKVFSFEKKKLLVEKISDDILNVGERIEIKGATFVVESQGQKLIVLRGLPGNITISEVMIQEFRKKTVDNIRKDKET